MFGPCTFMQTVLSVLSSFAIILVKKRVSCYTMSVSKKKSKLLKLAVCPLNIHNFNFNGQLSLDRLYILRKTIEGYLDSVPSLTFNTIKTKPIMHAFHSSRYLQSN